MSLSLFILSLIAGSAFVADPQPGPFVAIRVDYYRGGPVPADGTSIRRLGEQRGSGVVVGRAAGDDWFVLTNAHVVEADESVGRTVPNVYAGGGWRSGRVVSIDSEADLALVRLRFAQPLQFVTVSESPPPDGAKVETNGFAGGRKYCRRATTLRLALPLGNGARAWAPHRYYVQATFNPGESGGAVMLENRLVALIHGNDPAAGWGLVVDQKSVAAFLEPFLMEQVLED